MTSTPARLEDIPLVKRALTSVRDLASRAFRSDLCGLLNRAAYGAVADTYDATLANRAAVVFVDLTGFKRINDTFGYDAGNLCIGQAGRALASVVEPLRGMAFHFSGDEFVALLPPGRVGEFSEAFKARVQRTTLQYDGLPIAVRATAGAALPDDTATLSELLRRAESACKFAKRLGSALSTWNPVVQQDQVVDVRWRCERCAAETAVVMSLGPTAGSLVCPACRLPRGGDAPQHIGVD